MEALVELHDNIIAFLAAILMIVAVVL